MIQIAAVPDEGWGGLKFAWRGKLWIAAGPQPAEVRGEDATVSLRLLCLGDVPPPPKEPKRRR